MRKIKVVRSKQSSQRKTAIEPGDIAPIVNENFETLTNPPFKPSLELLEGDPHTPPTMDTNTDLNIKTDGEDGNQPSAEEVASGSVDYDNAPDVEKEQIPHENEKVKQTSKKASEEDSEDKDDTEGAEEEGEETVEASIQRLKSEYATKYALATRLFDIKLAAGVEEEINRYNFATLKADNEDAASLEAQIEDNQKFLNQIQASQPTETKKIANVTLPSGFTGGPSSTESPFNDDIEVVVMGGM